MSAPVIGMCASLEDVNFRVWNHSAVMLPRSYADAVQRAGGVAILLAPDDAVAERPDPVLGLLDGLLLAGGTDIDPMTYGAAPHPRTAADTSSERDRFEVSLAHRALERDLPVLGICRGMQMLNVATGGTLEQHLPDVVGGERHSPSPGTFTRHDVRLGPGSLAARAAGEERHEVSSHHHQGVAELGEGIVASGWAEPDDVVEAIEVPERRFALGVLWHPEEDVRSRVIAALVDAAGVKLPLA